MRFGQLTPTNEDMGQETAEEVSMVDTQQANQEVIDGELAMDQTCTTGEQIDDGLQTIGEGTALIEEAQTLMGGDEATGVATPLEVMTVESLVAGIHRSLGTERQAVQTVESHGHTLRSNIVATLEAEKQGLMASAMNGIKAAISAVVQFFKNLFMSKKALGKYIEGLKSQVMEYDGSKAGQDIPSKFTDREHAIGALQGIEGLVYNANVAADTLRGVLGKDLQHTGDEMPEQMAAEQTLDSLLEGLFGGGKVNAETRYAGGTTVSKGKAGKLTFTNGDVATGKAMSKEDCLRVLNAAASALKRLEGMTKVENVLVVSAKNLLAVMNAAARGLTDGFRGEEGKAKSKAKQLEIVATVIFRATAYNLGNKIPSFAFKNIKAAADYVKASIGGSGEAPKTPDGTAGE